MEERELAQEANYVAPQVEKVMTAEDVEREVQYAGRTTIIPGLS